MSTHPFTLDNAKLRGYGQSTPETEQRSGFLKRRHGSKARKLFDWLELELLPYLGKPDWLFGIDWS